MNFLDNVNYLEEKIPDDAWNLVNELTERVNGNGEIVIPYIKYLNVKLDLIKKQVVLNPDNELLELNKSLILLMITQLELTKLC